MSLLSICQDAARELSIAVPSAIVSATGNKDAQLLLRLAKKEGYELSRRASWVRLRKEHSFPTLAADSQGSASLPSDLSAFVKETMFNRTTRLPVVGPVTPQEWQEYKNFLTQSAEPQWLQRGDSILIMPEPSAGNTVYYEYLSTSWARAADGTTEQTTFLADTDTHIWPDDNILVQGLLWRWRKHKGMAFQDEQMTYERMVTDQIIRDGSKRRIDLNGSIGIITW